MAPLQVGLGQWLFFNLPNAATLEYSFIIGVTPMIQLFLWLFHNCHFATVKNYNVKFLETESCQGVMAHRVRTTGLGDDYFRPEKPVSVHRIILCGEWKFELFWGLEIPGCLEKFLSVSTKFSDKKGFTVAHSLPRRTS